jgi:hypothetical protein
MSIPVHPPNDETETTTFASLSLASMLPPEIAERTAPTFSFSRVVLDGDDEHAATIAADVHTSA